MNEEPTFYCPHCGRELYVLGYKHEKVNICITCGHDISDIFSEFGIE